MKSRVPDIWTKCTISMSKWSSWTICPYPKRYGKKAGDSKSTQLPLIPGGEVEGTNKADAD